MSLNLTIPQTDDQLKPRITVIGVGGAGGNAVNNMIHSNLEGVEFLVTDHVERFQHVGAHFLGTVPSPVRWVDLGPAVPPFTSP